MMFTEAITSMLTKTSVFTYYNITIKQSANKGVNYNKFLYTVNSNYNTCLNRYQTGYQGIRADWTLSCPEDKATLQLAELLP